MTTLEKVLGTPDSDPARLDLARGLADSDPARSELVRCQVALCSEGQDRYALVDRLARIAIDPAWEADVCSTGLTHPKYRPGWAFRRGFVEHVATTGKWLLSHGDALFDRAPVRSVLLTRVSDGELEELASRRWLSQLRHLGLVTTATAPLARLLDSPGLAGLLSLDLNWEAARPYDFPKPLGPKALEPVVGLLRSGQLPRLVALHVAVSSAKLATQLSSACPAIQHLGLRAQGGFSEPQASALGASMNLPALRSLRVSTLVEPSHAPLLEDLAVGGIAGAMSAELFARLKRFAAWNIHQGQLEQLTSLDGERLETLVLYLARKDAQPWSALGRARLPRLEALHVENGAPATAALLGTLETAQLFARLTSAGLTLQRPSVLESVRESMGQARELFVSWTEDPGDALALPERCERLSLGAHFGDEVLQKLLDSATPRLSFLAMAGTRNVPSFSDVGARQLMSKAGQSLACLWARLPSLSAGVAAELSRRFVVYDGGVKIDGSFGDMKDWRWPGHSWGPMPWEPRDGPIV